MMQFHLTASRCRVHAAACNTQHENFGHQLIELEKLRYVTFETEVLECQAMEILWRLIKHSVGL